MYQKYSVVLEKLIHRIKKFIDYKGLSMRKFDLSISASDGYTQRTLKNEGSVGSDILENIITSYPEINPYWLLAGEGEMIRSFAEKEGNETLNEPQASYENDFFEKTLLNYLEKPSIKNKIISLINNRLKERNYEGEEG